MKRTVISVLFTITTNFAGTQIIEEDTNKIGLKNDSLSFIRSKRMSDADLAEIPNWTLIFLTLPDVSK